MRKVDTWLESTREYALKKRERNTDINTLTCYKTTKPESLSEQSGLHAVFMSLHTFLTKPSCPDTEHQQHSGGQSRQRLLCCFLFLLVLSGSVTDCRLQGFIITTLLIHDNQSPQTTFEFDL